MDLYVWTVDCVCDSVGLRGLCVRTVVDYVLDYVIVYVDYVELCGLRVWTVLGRGLHVCGLLDWVDCMYVDCVVDWCVDCICAAG